MSRGPGRVERLILAELQAAGTHSVPLVVLACKVAGIPAAVGHVPPPIFQALAGMPRPPRDVIAPARHSVRVACKRMQQRGQIELESLVVTPKTPWHNGCRNYELISARLVREA